MYIEREICIHICVYVYIVYVRIHITKGRAGREGPVRGALPSALPAVGLAGDVEAAEVLAGPKNLIVSFKYESWGGRNWIDPQKPNTPNILD